MTVIPPMLVTIRFPDVDKAELVVTFPGQPSMIVPVSFATVRALNSKTAQALEHWPVAEIPAM